jgi:hypothetical protein
MKLLNERNQILCIYEDLSCMVENPNWGHAVWSKAVQKKKLEETKLLNPETAMVEDIDKIWDNNFFIGMYTCDECRTKSWNIISFSDEENEIFLCKECLITALDKISTGK